MEGDEAFYRKVYLSTRADLADERDEAASEGLKQNWRMSRLRLLQLLAGDGIRQVIENENRAVQPTTRRVQRLVDSVRKDNIDQDFSFMKKSLMEALSDEMEGVVVRQSIATANSGQTLHSITSTRETGPLDRVRQNTETIGSGRTPKLRDHYSTDRLGDAVDRPASRSGPPRQPAVPPQQRPAFSSSRYPPGLSAALGAPRPLGSLESNDNDNGFYEHQDSPDANGHHSAEPSGDFRSARDMLGKDKQQELRQRRHNEEPQDGVERKRPKTLGMRKRFVPPTKNRDRGSSSGGAPVKRRETRNGASGSDGASQEEELAHPALKGIDPALVEMISNDILDRSPGVTWDDIAGLKFAKKSVMEIVVWPLLRPDIFHGLRGPPKGLMLFGPPGTGKTMIGRAIATESGATFFSISASSLMSKWVGEGEKMVRALFAVANVHQPSVIFIDEIDSLLSQRSDGDFEASRRVKTEFLVQLDGAATNPDDRILLIGATNRPQELDEAARRRMVKRLYIPLPDAVARHDLVLSLLRKHNQLSALSDADLDEITRLSEKGTTDFTALLQGYSGSDIRALCTEAALGPIREMQVADIRTIEAANVRPIQLQDFLAAFNQVRASVSKGDLKQYLEWNETFGSFASLSEDEKKYAYS